MVSFRKMYYIAKKDIREYYLKPPAVSWGILFPAAFTFTFIIRSRENMIDLIPGLITMALFFGSTSMSSASIVFERRIGAFERLLIYPASYIEIACGKVLSSFIFGLISSTATITLIIPLFKLKPASYPYLLLSIPLSTLLFSSFGILLAFIAKDPYNAMAIFNSVRFPMIFLGGIFIPVSKIPSILKPISMLIPLTYSVDAVRYSILGFYDIFPPSISIVLIISLTLFFIYMINYLIKRSIP